MSFKDMYSELRGIGGDFPVRLGQTYINRALVKIYDEATWSFQLQESGWVTQAAITAGTITAKLGVPSLTGDAVAKAAWMALPPGALITQFQIRQIPYALYNIVAFDSATGVLTLDRPWLEVAVGAGLPYIMYQAYYPAPVPDLKRWFSQRDTTNSFGLDFFELTRADLDLKDPQRIIQQLPTHVVPFAVDARPNSATLGRMLYELWPHPLTALPYPLYYARRGALLVSPGDTVPYPVTEELVLWRAKELIYEWKESQKGSDDKRGSGANWQYLQQQAHSEYADRLKDIKKLDRDLAELYMTRIRRRRVTQGEFFSAVSGLATV